MSVGGPAGPVGLVGLERLIDLLPDFIFVKDARGRYLMVNEALAKAYARSPADLVSLTDADFLPVTVAARGRAGELRAMDEDREVTQESTLCFPDGRARTIVANVAPFRDAAGNVRGVVGVVRDVTEQRRADEALRFSEMKFAQAFANNPAAIALTRVSDGVFLEVNDTWTALSGFSREEAIGRSSKQLGIWPRAADRDRFVAELTKHGRVHFWEQEFCKKSGERYVAELSAQLLKIDGNEAVLCTLVDITARKRSELLLQRANRTLKAIRDCHEAMLRAETEQELLEEVCRIIVQSGGERMAWVGYADKDARKSVRPVASAGASVDYLRHVRVTWADVPRGRGPVGTAVRSGMISLCDNTFTDARFAPWREGAREHGYGSVIALPLKSGQQCFGALAIYAAEPGAFDATEQLMFMDLASDLAFGINALRLRRERAGLENAILESSEREQERIGRDLHDGLCQLLVGAKFRSVYLQKLCAEKLPPAHKEALMLEEELNHAIEQARDLARGLQPVKTTSRGLAGALKSLADTVAAMHAQHCFCHVQPGLKVADHQIAGHLYRIAQEAVQNAQKHAQASHIAITLSAADGMIALTVKDDGVGITGRCRPGCMGLNNMRTRARLIGGQLEIRRRKHGGTAVCCRVPQKQELKG